MKYTVFAIHASRSHDQDSVPFDIAAFFFVALIFLIMTIGADWRYSVDLQVLRDVTQIYPFTNDFISALADNSTLVWLVVQWPNIVDIDFFLKSIYIFAFFLKTSVLFKLFGSIAGLSFSSLFFFSIDLNQARMSLAISFLLFAWWSWNMRYFFIAYILLVVSVFCHYPGALTILLFYLAGRFPKLAIGGFTLAIAAVVAMMTDADAPIFRYLAYFEGTANEGTAFFFIVTGLLYVLFRHRLSLFQCMVSIIAIIISFLFRELLNLSGRVSELTATAILLAAFLKPPNRLKKLNVEHIALIIGILFFAYRFIQWVIFNKIPIQSNL